MTRQTARIHSVKPTALKIHTPCRPSTFTGSRLKTRWLKFFAVLLLAAGNVAGAGERGLPPSEGIVNFGKVNDSLYRGAQPDALGIRRLKKLGIKTIINLRMTNDVWKAEEAEANANGITYTNVPMKGFGRPTPEQVAKALALIETLPSPVFVHCEYGCDRTGTIIACYRIKHNHWSSDSAWQEARHYGISKFEWAMRKYIVEFGQASAQQ
jgi:protein tyrosine/serine phosphatase